MELVAKLMELIFNSAEKINALLVTDFGSQMGWLGKISSLLNLNFTGYTLLGLIGGTGLVFLIIYSIVKP